MGRHLKAFTAGVVAWIIGALFVRVALDWSDSQPYQGSVTETRYIVIAAIALAIGIGGTLLASIWWWRTRKAATEHRYPHR